MRMKGQFIFEFLVASIMFFTILLFVLNFLNTSVTDYKGRFDMDVMENKAIKATEAFASSESGLSLTDGWPVFSNAKLTSFNSTYCTNQYANQSINNSKIDEQRLVQRLDLNEKTLFGIRPHYFNLTVTGESGNSLLNCGFRVPANITKTEMVRVGIQGNGQFAKLKIVVW